MPRLFNMVYQCKYCKLVWIRYADSAANHYHQPGIVDCNLPALPRCMTTAQQSRCEGCWDVEFDTQLKKRGEACHGRR